MRWGVAEAELGRVPKGGIAGGAQGAWRVLQSQQGRAHPPTPSPTRVGPQREGVEASRLAQLVQHEQVGVPACMHAWGWALHGGGLHAGGVMGYSRGGGRARSAQAAWWAGQAAQPAAKPADEEVWGVVAACSPPCCGWWQCAPLPAAVGGSALPSPLWSVAVRSPPCPHLHVVGAGRAPPPLPHPSHTRI